MDGGREGGGEREGCKAGSHRDMETQVTQFRMSRRWRDPTAI
jgi:hypothetical protein